MSVLARLAYSHPKHSIIITKEEKKLLVGISKIARCTGRNCLDNHPAACRSRQYCHCINCKTVSKDLTIRRSKFAQSPYSTKSHHELNIRSTVQLNNGTEMPRFGLGVYKSSPGTETKQAVSWAIQNGYSMIDTASRYANEHDVGAVMRNENLPRSSLFIVTKVWDDMHGYDQTIVSLKNSLNHLTLKYVDLFLIHSPLGGKIVDTWRAMIKLLEDGYTRSIGVSNFGIHHLAALSKYSSILPAVNQIEAHPFNQERAVVCYCKENNIQVMAYSPLTRGLKINHPVLVSIARKHNKTSANVLIRWSLQKDMICIPKSVKERHIKENRDVFDFQLDETDMKYLDLLEENFRTGQDRLSEKWMP